MIISKPKFGTLFSIIIFSVPLLVVGILGFSRLLDSPEWYHYAMAIVGTPIGAGLLLRQLVSYKTITVGKKKLSIKYLLRLKPTVYGLNEIDHWKEEVVKTGTGTYKEIDIHWGKRSILKVSVQEYSHYDKIANYFKKNYPKKILRN